jgi:hypothetical protein
MVYISLATLLPFMERVFKKLKKARADRNKPR